MCYPLEARPYTSDRASVQPTLSETQERLQATWRLRQTLHIVHLPFNPLTCAVFSVSVAFLGDIALDEEDMRMFKVDRIIDLAQRTVQMVNHTDTGNNNNNNKNRFKDDNIW